MAKTAHAIVLIICGAALALGGTRLALAILYSDWQLGRVGLIMSLALLVAGGCGLVVAMRKKQGAFIERHKDKIVLTFFSFLISLGLAEVLINLFRPAMPQFVQLDPELGWVPKPNVAGIVNERLGQPRFYASTDEFGLNGIVGEGDSIILLIGDSMLNAFYDPEYSAPQVFLVSDQVTKRYRIANGSVGAYGTDQELLRMKQLLRRLQHVSDVVVCFLPLNDFANNVWHEVYMKGVGTVPKPFFEIHGDSLVYYPPAPLPEDPFARPAIERFGLYRAWSDLRNILEGAISDAAAPINERSDTFDTYFKGQYAAELSSEFRSAQRLTARLFREMKNACEQHRVTLHLFAFDSPRFLSFMSHGESMQEKCRLQRNFERTVEETFRMAGLPFTWIVLEEDELIPGDIHPNRKGIARIAQIVMGKVASASP
jgi:hypothetical protein